MHGILFLRCHARLKSRLRAAVMWQMHVINKPSFVLCSFQIIEPAVAVSLNALDFTVCYDLTKVHFNSADCLNTQMLLLSRIKNGDCYVLCTKAEKGLPTTDYRLPTSDFRLPTSDFQLGTSNFQLPTSDFRLPTSDFQLPTSDFRLPNCARLPLLNTDWVGLKSLLIWLRRWVEFCVLITLLYLGYFRHICS